MGEKKDYLINKVIVVMLVVTLILVLITFGLSAAFDGKNTEAAALDSLEFSGEMYSAEGESEAFEGKPILASGTERLLIKGHFDNNIEKGSDIMFFVERLYVTVKINDEVVLDIHETEGTPNSIMATGSTWASFKSKGISPKDQVEFDITSSRENVVPKNVEKLFDSICQGEAGTLYQQMLEENGIQLFFGFVAIFGGFVLFLVSMFSIGSNYAYMKRIVAISLMIIFGGIWFLLDTNCVYISMIISNHAVHNFLDFSISFLMPISVVLYLLTLLENGRTKRALYDTIFVMLILTIISFILQLVGAKQLYEVQELAIVCGLLMLFAIGVFVVDFIKNKNRLNRIVTITLIPGIIGGFLQVVSYLSDTSLVSEHLFSIGIMISVLSQLIVLTAAVRINAKKLKDLQEWENQQIRTRILITLSQLQPHFLFNALNAIKYLCTINPEKAKTGIENFAKCLRANIDSLKLDHPIEFAQELKHLKSYVYIERLRFGEDIEVTYDIETEDFLLPPLTVQPIVENAIRHGITQKEGGGIITVSTRTTEDGIIVAIADDGVGFDINLVKNEGQKPEETINANKPHVGITSVRSRIAAMCNGTVEVESAKDVGTTVTIFLPKGKK